MMGGGLLLLSHANTTGLIDIKCGTKPGSNIGPFWPEIPTHFLMVAIALTFQHDTTHNTPIIVKSADN